MLADFSFSSSSSFFSSSPDLNHDHPCPVFPAGPQPRPSTPSVPCRTSTTTFHAQCSLPDLDHGTQPQTHNNKHNHKQATTTTTTNTQSQTQSQAHSHTQSQTHNHRHNHTQPQTQSHTQPQTRNHKHTIRNTTTNTTTNTQPQTRNHKHNYESQTHNHKHTHRPQTHNHKHTTQPQHTTQGPTTKIENYHTQDHGNMLLTMASRQMINVMVGITQSKVIGACLPFCCFWVSMMFYISAKCLLCSTFYHFVAALTAFKLEMYYD